MTDGVVRLAIVHDLPPRWDGLPVAWRGWESLPITSCRAWGSDRCASCGSDKRSSINFGIVGDSAEMTPRDVRANDAACRIAPLSAAVFPKRKAWIRLIAFRCPDCGHDQVDDGTDFWDLDPSDYTDDGSHHPDTTWHRPT